MEPSSTKLDEIILQNEEEGLLLFDFEKNIAGQPARKYNSLNDLLLQGPVASKVANKRTTATGGAGGGGGGGGAGPYSNVESKVKNYIASLPPPKSQQRRPFKKHTSMPSCSSLNGGGSETPTRAASHMQLEQEYTEYRRQSQHQISELEKKVQVALAMITQANNENFDLMDQIVHLQSRRDAVAAAQAADANKATPETTATAAVVSVRTPRKVLPRAKGRLLTVPGAEDTTGSFIGQSSAAVTQGTGGGDEGEQRERGETEEEEVPVVAVLTAVPMGSPQGRRNLSFNSSGDLTRRSGSGTDSGINSSGGGRSGNREVNIQGMGESSHSDRTGTTEEQVEQEEQEEEDVNRKRRKKGKGKRKRVKRYLGWLVCCGGAQAKRTASADEGWPKITYKKL